MTVLTVFREDGEGPLEAIREPAAIAERMQTLGALFERWEASCDLSATASQEDILGAYAASVARLKVKYGFESADVISVNSDHPQKADLRAKFLNEHTHSDFEVRFFVGGRGLFYLHPDDNVYVLLCERGDLISVPNHLRHWFDLGAEPDLKCIRLFTTPEGWVADFTGSDISTRFPRLEAFREAFA